MPNPKIKNLTPILSDENPTLDKIKTAAQISSLRKELDIDQKNLAYEMGISISYLSDLESANRNWSLKLFNKAKIGLGNLDSEREKK